MNQRRFNRRDFLRMSSLAVGGTVLAACAGATATPAPSGPATAAPTTAPTTGGAAAGQVLRRRTPAAFTSVLPQVAGGETREFVLYAFAPPYWPKPGGGAIPGFALSHDVSDDFLTWTLHIDPQAVFSNGKPITAAAVKKCWEWGMWPANQVAFGGSYLVLKYVTGAVAVWEGSAEECEGLVAVDDQTLEIKFATVPYGWEGALTVHYLGVFDAEAAIEDPEGFLTKPVCSGPMVVELNASTGEATLTRNPTWWREPATIERFENIIISSDESALIAFENKEVDLLMAWFQLATSTQQRWPELNHLTRQNPAGLWYLDFNCGLAPTDDVWVRRALLHSIDRHAANDAIGGGSIHMLDSVISPGYPCYNADQTIPYDPEQARQELAQSSYGSAANVPIIKAYYPAGRALWGDFLTYFQDQWTRELGLQVEVSEVTGPRPEDWNLYRISFGSAIADESYYLSQMYGPTGAQRTTNQCFSEELDAIFEQADTMAPSMQAERCDLYLQAEAMILEDAKLIPLGETIIYWSIQPTIKWDAADFVWPYLINWPYWRVEGA